MKHSLPYFIIIFQLSLFLTLLQTGCSSQRLNPLLSQAIDPKLSLSELKSIHKNLNELWKKRSEKTQLLEFIKVSQSITNEPSTSETDLSKLARALYILAEYLTPNPNESKVIFENAANYAEKALSLNPNFRTKIIQEHLPPEQALTVLTFNDSEPLYWLAVNLGKWASLDGVQTMLNYKVKVKKMIDRVAELNPDLLHGAVLRYYGVYYALLPEFTASDLSHSKSNFETGIKKYPEYFANHVLYAEYYATKVENQKLFTHELKQVIHGNPRLIKEFIPEQILEQEKAKKLLEKANHESKSKA